MRSRRALATAAGATIVFGLGVLVDIEWRDDLWRFVLAAATVALYLVSERVVPPRRRVVAVAMLAVLAFGASAGRDLWKLARTGEVRVWNVFHYYLGSKYFGELGYHDLYAAALVADQEGEGRWRDVRRVRDLRSYEPVSRAEAEATFDPGRHFTPERWNEFRRDVGALQPHGSGSTWRGIFLDRGYNPSPLWSAVGGRLAELLPATSRGALVTLCLLDLLLLGATVFAVGRFVHWEAAALLVLFLVVAPVNAGRLVGGFLQFDWLVAGALGLVALRRGRQGWAAIGIAWAVATRVFPLVLVGSAAVPLVWRWVLTGRLGRRWRPFFGAFALALALGIGLGALTPQGLSAWKAFGDNLRHHRHQHVVGERRVGLEHFFTHDWSRPLGEESKRERRENLARQQRGYQLGAAALLLMWGVASLRRTVPDAALLGLVPLFALAVSSRYYWAYLALLPLLARPGPRGRRWWRVATAGQAAVYAVAAAYALGHREPFAEYVVLNLALGLFLVGLCAVYWRWDLAVVRRWWIRWGRSTPADDAGGASSR